MSHGGHVREEEFYEARETKAAEGMMPVDEKFEAIQAQCDKLAIKLDSVEATMNRLHCLQSDMNRHFQVSNLNIAQRLQEERKKGENDYRSILEFIAKRTEAIDEKLRLDDVRKERVAFWQLVGVAIGVFMSVWSARTRKI